MAQGLINDSTLTGIANAIRGKTGGSASLLPSQMAQAINSIPSGGINILHGATNPTSEQGNDGDIYLKTGLLGALLHFDDSATSDEIDGNVWSANGSPSVSDVQKKFGTKSLYLNGNSYLQSNVNEENFNFGSNDFTITCWVYPNSSSRMAVFAMSTDCRISTDIFFGQNSANLWMSSNGSSWNIIQSDSASGNTGQGTIALSANTWTHLAYVRNGTKVTMYVDGQKAREVTLSSESVSVYWSGYDGFRIGEWGNGYYKFNGYIDEFLVLNGKALWTDAFTPPSSAFDESDLSNIVVNSYIKLNGSWQNLIGTDIDDVIH